MVHDLEMPFALAGSQIYAYQTLTKEIVAWPVTTVEVRRRRLDRQVHETQLFVDTDLSPDSGVAVGSPRVVVPGVVAELAGSQDCVEGPEQPACPYIKSSHKTLGVVVGLNRHPFLMSGADNHHVLHHGWR